MTDIRTLADAIKKLTVLEASDLAKILKEELNIPDAPAAVAVASAAAPAAAEEKAEFNVILKSVSAENKIAVLKVIREITGLGLGEAKAFVESAPKTIKENVAKAEADEMKKKVETAGGVVTLE